MTPQDMIESEDARPRDIIESKNAEEIDDEEGDEETERGYTYPQLWSADRGDRALDLRSLNYATNLLCSFLIVDEEGRDGHGDEEATIPAWKCVRVEGPLHGDLITMLRQATRTAKAILLREENR